MRLLLATVTIGDADALKRFNLIQLTCYLPKLENHGEYDNLDRVMHALCKG